MAAIVDAGIRAPSGDNCQPWRFSWDGERLRIIFVSERAESFYDVREAASWVSLGTVLTNMTVAARSLGFRLRVELFPQDEPQDIVAKGRLEPAEASGDPLFAAIDARCVNRRPYRAEPLPAAVRDELLGLGASVPGVHLSWIEAGPAKARLAALAAQNDRFLFENKALHDGLYRWLRWTRAEIARSRDGMPVETLELSRLERPGFRLLGSWQWARLLTALGLSRTLPSRARRIYQRSGAIALLATNGRRPEDFVRAGEVLERIWLTATLRGVALQPITGITFLLLRLSLAGGAGLSPQHRRLLEQRSQDFRQIFPAAVHETPVMLFRLGLAPPPSARAPRLPPQEILFTKSLGH